MKQLVASIVTVIIVLSSLTLYSAYAEKPYYGRWECGKTVTWKTNKFPKMTKVQAKKINNTVDSFRLKRIKSGRADITIKFAPESKVKDAFPGSLGSTHFGFGLNSDYFSSIDILTTNFGPGQRKATKRLLIHEFWHGVGMDHINPIHRVSIMNPWVAVDNPTRTDWSRLKGLDNKC